MNGLIANFPYTGVVTVSRVILKPEYSVDDLQERPLPCATTSVHFSLFNCEF